MKADLENQQASILLDKNACRWGDKSNPVRSKGQVFLFKTRQRVQAEGDRRVKSHAWEAASAACGTVRNMRNRFVVSGLRAYVLYFRAH